MFGTLEQRVVAMDGWSAAESEEEEETQPAGGPEPRWFAGVGRCPCPPLQRLSNYYRNILPRVYGSFPFLAFGSWYNFVVFSLELTLKIVPALS